MMPAPTLFRKAFLMLCSAAAWSLSSGNAGAENSVRLTECLDLNCFSWTTWNVPYVRQALMITNEQLAVAVAANSLPYHLEKLFSEFSTPSEPEHAVAKERLNGMVQYAKNQALEMAIPLPDMYVSMLTTQAAQTREGKNFILLNKDKFRLAVVSDEGMAHLKIAISREFAHIRNGDTSASAVANHHNDPAAAREAALRADLMGAGPLGAHNPIAVTAAIEDNLRDEFHRLIFLKDSSLDGLDANRLSDRDYKQISDEHVRVYNDPHNFAAWDRIMALRKGNRLMAEYEQTHAVRTHADREVESKWLVDQVLGETQCKIQGDPTKADSQPCSQADQAK